LLKWLTTWALVRATLSEMQMICLEGGTYHCASRIWNFSCGHVKTEAKLYINFLIDLNWHLLKNIIIYKKAKVRHFSCFPSNNVLTSNKCFWFPIFNQSDSVFSVCLVFKFYDDINIFTKSTKVTDVKIRGIS
jgi:hypothetical protein